MAFNKVDRRFAGVSSLLDSTPTKALQVHHGPNLRKYFCRVWRVSVLLSYLWYLGRLILDLSRASGLGKGAVEVLLEGGANVVVRGVIQP